MFRRKNRIYNLYLFLAVVLLFLSTCTNTSSNFERLPILGERQGIESNGDTIYATIPKFSFVDQDSQTITDKTFDGKLYVVDFFFTNCPTICPKVTSQMLRVHDRFKDSSNLLLLSHTIDVKYDTIPKLKFYANKLGIKLGTKWHFVTGNEDEIYSIANKYFSVAKKDPNTPGGFDHSGRLILVDAKKCVRAFCDGTNEQDVNRFMKDIERLMLEK